MRVSPISPINVIITYRAGRYNLGEITMKPLTVEIKFTELPQFNYLVDLIARYQDQLPQAMIDELSEFVKVG